jgi:hypothetical protein
MSGNQLLSVCQQGETYDDEKYNSGCEVRADGLTTVEVVDSRSDVGVGIRHINGLLVKEMSVDGESWHILIAKLA